MKKAINVIILIKLPKTTISFSQNVIFDLFIQKLILLRPFLLDNLKFDDMF